MPNHVHGIIEIAKSNDGFGMDGVLGGAGGDSGVETGGVEMQNFASLHGDTSTKMDKLKPSIASSHKNKFGQQLKHRCNFI